VHIGRIEVAGEVRFCEPVSGGVQPLSGSPESGFEADGTRIPEGEYRLLSPVRPGKVLVILGGFPRGQMVEQAPKAAPRFAAKLPSSVIAHGDQVVVPEEIGTAVTVEPELAVVIGARARRCSPGEASAAILGFTCFNDVTHLPFIRQESDFLRAKSVDTFGPLGPWIDTELREEDVAAGLRIRALVNGTVVHTGNTADFIHPVSQVVSEASRYYTLEPGDVISLGTPLDPVTASVGDTVCVEVERVGSLVNQLVGEGGGLSPSARRR
jgi:2-keto-4-pentenoate hydratase/2-oxohepta-3-ene-1,7-dioic acid hydratase in catechol pathway